MINLHIKDNIIEEIKKVKGYINGMMVLITKENGIIMKYMVMVNIHGKMVLDIKVIFNTIREQAMER